MTDDRSAYLVEEVRLLKKQTQNLDKLEVLGNTLIELFFHSSVRFEEIELKVTTFGFSQWSNHHFVVV